MTSSEKHDCLEALYEELSAIQHTMNISRCWAGNGIACRNLDRREAEICRAINSMPELGPRPPIPHQARRASPTDGQQRTA